MPVFGEDSPVFNDIGGIVGYVSGEPMLAPILGHGLRDAFYIAEYEKFYSIAEKYINSGAYDLALVNLDKSLENFNETDCQNFLQSDLSNIYSEKGRVQILLKRYNESEKWCDSAIEANTQNKYAWNNKGVALVNLGQYNNAIKCYDNARAIDPNFALAYNNRNVALQASQSYNAPNNWQGNQVNEGSQVTPNVSSDIGAPGNSCNIISPSAPGSTKCYLSPDGKTHTCVSSSSGPCEWTQTNILGVTAWALQCNSPSPFQYSYGEPGTPQYTESQGGIIN
jgi:hypothetical protein